MGINKIEKSQADVAGRLTGDRLEAKIVNNNKLECPICHRTFNDRPDYDSHWLACHEDEGLSMASGSMGSMQTGESCETNKAPSAD